MTLNSDGLPQASPLGLYRELTKKEFYALPFETKCLAALSDGVFYNAAKLSKVVREPYEQCQEWLDKKFDERVLVRYKDNTGNWRMPYDGVLDYYADHKIPLTSRIASGLYAPRLWGGMTEAEGFIDAPLREVSYVSFKCEQELAEEVIRGLKGIARVRSAGFGSWRAYCLSGAYTKDRILSVANGRPIECRIRSCIKRREFVDFDPEFGRGMLMFYTEFARTLTKGHRDTINIFIPDVADQRSQFTMWVMEAAEKFNEKESVPFSGYLSSVLQRWPYDLPVGEVGSDVAAYQRKRKRILTRTGKPFSLEFIAGELGLTVEEVRSLETRHVAWSNKQYSSSLTWEEKGEEKASVGSVFGSPRPASDLTDDDLKLASIMSISFLDAAIKTGNYRDLHLLIEAAADDEFDLSSLSLVEDETVREFKSAYLRRTRHFVQKTE